MYMKMDFEEFLNRNITSYDYAIIDPPWNYDDKPPALLNNQLTYNLWENVKLEDVFQKLNVKYIFLWVTTSMLPVMFECSKNSNYTFKSLVPWIKLTPNDNLFYGLGNSFRNCVEYVALFQRNNERPLRLDDRNLIIDRTGSRTEKPKLWERDLTCKLAAKGLKGVYIFSGGNLDFIDCVDVVEDPKASRVDLF